MKSGRALIIWATGILIGAHGGVAGTDPRPILDLDFRSAETMARWYVVNDNVMGGRSQGDFVAAPAGLRFSGATNTRGGGFSSIRMEPPVRDLSSTDGLRLRVRGDGRTYQLRLRTKARAYGIPVSYAAPFATEPGVWIETTLAFEEFVPAVRGRRLRGPELDTSALRELGLMIYDGLDGPFELEVAWIRSVAE